MNDQHTQASAQLAVAEPNHSVTWLVFKQEFVELWLGGRVFNLLILFSVLMSITAFLLATNNEVRLLPIGQTVQVALLAAITFGLFNGLVIAAESISGERERDTLEALLLTPASRQQIVIGKLLAALSPWPITLLLSTPYLVVLAKGEPVLGQALLWGGIMGTLLSVAFTGLAMLLSIWSNASRISLGLSLLVYVLALIPAQLPAEFQATPAGVLIAAVNPLESSRQFLEKILIYDQGLAEIWFYLAAPIVFVGLLLSLLIFYAAPRISLDGGRANLRWRVMRQAASIE